MQLNKIILKTLAATSLLLTTLNAADIEAVAEAKYGIANAKATSYVNTASDTTVAPNFSLGAQYKEYNVRALLNYKPFRWEDAKADLISVSIDYLYELTPEIELFGGAGVGQMTYKALGLKDTQTVYTLQTGVQYSFTKHFYSMLNINYLHTNNLKIQKNSYLYSELENFLGTEIGLGFRW